MHPECSTRCSSCEALFAKALGTGHTGTPRVILVDKNAAYLKAHKELKAERTIPETCENRVNCGKRSNLQ
jgi:transposase, IS6 family